MTSNVATYPIQSHHSLHHSNSSNNSNHSNNQWNGTTAADEISAPRSHPAGSRRGDAKDSRWLTLEVCIDHLKGTCHKREEDCMMAHVPNGGSSNISSSNEFTQDRRVMCCYDFIKGKCYRKDPPCKFFHPPPHLREVLLHNGRQNLLLKSQRSQLPYGAVPVLPQAVLPMVYNPAVLNPMMTSKMSEGAQIQFLSNHCVVNQGGVAYFYPFIVGTDGWVTIPTNGIHGCQVVPSPPLHGSLKQVDQLGGFEEVISPWLQNGYSVPQAAMCGPFCYGYGQGLVKRPSNYDLNKVQ